ncbi:AAA family ATPase [Rhodoplanes sp. SY1]|uniref:AAA family ATPase n=1 Tax=Rhodoplanes sp. SY1 TaxID=3166646 RepID=UPI0038B51787
MLVDPETYTVETRAPKAHRPDRRNGKRAPKGFVRTGTNGIMATQFEPLRWTVPGFVPEGLSILAGRQKLGKTWLAIDFAVAVAIGGTAIGGVPCEAGDVLYIDLENGPRRIQRRVRTLFPDERTRPDLSRLEWATESPELGPDFLEALDEWRTSVASPALVVVDVFQRIKPAGNAARNSYENDYVALSSLQQWATGHGVSVLVLHHTRKGGADDPLESLSGSNGLSACADTTLVLDRTAAGVTLYVRGRDVEEREAALRFDAGRWYLLGEAAEVQRTDERTQVLNALRDAGEGLSPTEVADLTGMSNQNARQMLVRMARAGEVVKLGRGRYAHPCHNQTPCHNGHNVTMERGDDEGGEDA